MNLFDNDVVIEAGSAIVFRDVPSNTNLLKVLYTPADPNGILPGPLGSLAAGPTGLYQNVDGGTVWAIVGSSPGGITQLASFSGPLPYDDTLPGEKIIATLATIPAGAMNHANRSIRLHWSTLLTSAGAPGETTHFRIRLGGLAGIVLADLGAVLPGPAPKFIGHGTLATVTPGALGTVSLEALVLSLVSVSAGGGIIPPTGPVDLTVAQDLVMTVEFSVVGGGAAGFVSPCVADLGPIP